MGNGFAQTVSNSKHPLVVVDYFMEWIKVEPLTKIIAQNVQKFLWKNIVTRIDIPHTIITNNGLQFIDTKPNDFMKGLNITHQLTSVEHPQTNGHAELAKKAILVELKNNLTKLNGNWPRTC